jgi:hypothetical protein
VGALLACEMWISWALWPISWILVTQADFMHVSKAGMHI